MVKMDVFHPAAVKEAIWQLAGSGIGFSLLRSPQQRKDGQQGQSQKGVFCYDPFQEKRIGGNIGRSFGAFLKRLWEFQ